MVSPLVMTFLSFPLDLALTIIHYLVISSPMCHLSPGLDPREKKLYGIVTYIEYTAATPDARWSQKSSSVQQNQT